MNDFSLVQVLDGFEHLDAKADDHVRGETVLAVGEQPLLQVARVQPGIDQHGRGSVPRRSQQRLDVVMDLGNEKKKGTNL